MGTEGLSIADAMSLAKNSDGSFGGNGAWVFFLFFLLAWGGGGLWGGNGARQAATTDDVQNQFNFAALERQNNETVAAVRQASYDVTGAVKDGNTFLNSTIKDIGFDINGELKDNATVLGSAIRDVKDVVQANNYEIGQASCSINRNIDALRYDNAMNTKELLASNCAQTQKILDVLAGNRMADMQNQINSLQLQAALCGVVRFPMASTYNAGPNPYFNSGCCGNSSY